MKLDHDKAFDPLFTDSVHAVAKRQDGVSSLTYAGHVDCLVMIGANPGEVGQARQPGEQFTVIVRALNYPAPDGPRFGDQLSHLIHGDLTIQQVQRYANDYELQCTGKGVRR
jgi:hypothetical protein